MSERKKGAYYSERKNGAYYFERKKVLDSIKTLMKKSPAKAFAHLRSELDEHPEDMYCWHYYGQILMNNGDYVNALDAFTRVYESDSRNKYAGLVGMADIIRINGNIEKAIELYQKAIDDNPNENRSTYYMLARLKCKLRMYDEAIDVLKRVEECEETKIELMITYIEAGKLEEANEISKLIVPADDKDRRYFAYANGKSLAINGEYELAAACFQAAKQSGEKDVIYYKTLIDEALLAIEMGDYQLAADDCEEVISSKSDGYSDLYLALGKANQGLGKYQEAISCYQKGLKSACISEKLKMECVHRISCLQLISGDIESAEITLKSYVNCGVPIGIQNVEVLLNIYITKGRYKEAAELIRAAKPIYVGSEDAKSRLDYAKKIVKVGLGKLKKSQAPTFQIYRQRQVVDYNKEEAISHIIERHQQDDDSRGRFAQNIDIRTLYDEVQTQLIPENKTAGELLDRYYIDYPDAGYYPNGEIINRICAIVIPGTKQILTMYPDNGLKMVIGKDVATALNKQKEKTIGSRSARFNKRFGLSE